MFNEQLKAEGLRRILGVGAAGLAGGAGLAGLIHLFKQLNQPKVPSYRVPEDIDLPYPQPKEKKAALAADAIKALTGSASALGTYGAIKGSDEGGLAGAGEGALQMAKHIPLTALGNFGGMQAGSALADRWAGGGKYHTALSTVLKLLGATGGATTGYMISKPTMRALEKKTEKQSGLAEDLVHRLLPTTPGEPTPGISDPAWLRGDSQKEVGAIPWVSPGVLMAGTAGLASGSALVNWIMKKRRKAGLKSELAKAQQDYEQAMLAQYDPDKVHKIGSAVTIDDLAERVEKRAFDFNGMLGKGTGLYLALASMLAGGTGLGTYRMLKGRSDDELLEKALKQRAMLRSLAHPSDIYVHPVRANRKNQSGMPNDLDTEESPPSL